MINCRPTNNYYLVNIRINKYSKYFCIYKNYGVDFPLNEKKTSNLGLKLYGSIIFLNRSLINLLLFCFIQTWPQGKKLKYLPHTVKNIWSWKMNMAYPRFTIINWVKAVCLSQKAKKRTIHRCKILAGNSDIDYVNG